MGHKRKNITKLNTVSEENVIHTPDSTEIRNDLENNNLLLVTLIILPFISLLYVISNHSNVLINNRIGYFFLISIILLTFLVIMNIVKIVKAKIKIKGLFWKLSLYIVYVAFLGTVGLLLYGKNDSLRKFMIDKAMQTTDYQYFARWFFDEKTISENLAELKDATNVEITGSKRIEFDEIKYNQEIYENEYEEAILSKENEDDIYKIIKIEGTTIGADKHYRGYLVAVYDPSKVKIATSTGAGTHEGSYGEILSIIAKKNKALVAMNAGGFYDPYWNSNGGIPHGTVIKDGKVVSEFRRGDVSGGMIGFTKDNKLVLKRMTTQEAVEMGIRDGVDWGPFLIVDGKNQYKDIDYYTWATSRTVIGQRKDGIVLMLVIDGGNQPGSVGASYADVAKIMENYGAINAANLDGGTSAALVENNEYVNTPWNGYQRTIRSLPNAWIVTE